MGSETESTGQGGVGYTQGDPAQPNPAANTGHINHTAPQAPTPDRQPAGPSRQELYDSINSIPEKVADAIKEMLPKPQKTTPVEPAQSKEVKAQGPKESSNEGVQGMNLTSRERFVRWWHGG